MTGKTTPRAFRRAKPSRGTDPRPGARAPELDRIIEVRDGEPVTVADRIVQLVRQGVYADTAAATLGVDKLIYHRWVHRGALMRSARIADPHFTMSAHDVQCMELNTRVEAAEGEWEARTLAMLERLAQGGIEQRTTTTTERVLPDGTLERTTVTKVEYTLPDAATMKWRLERKIPERYIIRQGVDVRVSTSPVPPEAQASALLDTMRALTTGDGDNTTTTE